MTKMRIISLTALIILTLALVSAIAFARPHEATPEEMGLVVAKNQTFAMCMQDAVAVKKSSFEVANIAKNSCFFVARNVNESRAKLEAGKNCISNYDKSMSNAKKTFNESRNECKKVKHNFWEGFISNFQ